MPVSRKLRAALRWGEDEVTELAAELLDHKVFTYVETLSDLLDERGVEHAREDIVLSDAILKALRAESRLRARQIVNTFNTDLDGFLERNGELPRARLIDTYSAWASDRAQNRAELIAITEAYGPAADAQLAFAAANAPEGLEPSYDFGGHGDDDPVCDVCRELEQTSPHPHSRVLAIGNPHPGCRQDWHEVDSDEHPEEYRLPTKPAGLVGAEHIVIREGGHEQAVDAIRGLVDDG